MILSKNQLKRYRLLQQKKYREKDNLFVVEGRKIVFEVIKHSPDLVIDIICTEGLIPELPEKWRSKALITNYETISKISSLTTAQEIIGIIAKPQHLDSSAKSKEKLILALDNIVDPGNLGTIIRMADWFGIENIYCSINCVDCFNPKVVQSTMGGILRVTVHYIDLYKHLATSINKGVAVYGTTLDGENIYRKPIKFPAILVMGNESTGISDKIKSLIGNNLLIPNFSDKKNTSESLNVSTATAIALSEFKRQQLYSK